MKTLTEKVRALAEEVEFCLEYWWDSQSYYEGRANNYLIQVKAACREYSGILRGMLSQLRGPLYILTAQAINECKQIWRETLKGE